MFGNTKQDKTEEELQQFAYNVDHDLYNGDYDPLEIPHWKKEFIRLCDELYALTAPKMAYIEMLQTVAYEDMEWDEAENEWNALGEEEQQRWWKEDYKGENK